jgi:hypothetical protein
MRSKSFFAQMEKARQAAISSGHDPACYLIAEGIWQKVPAEDRVVQEDHIVMGAVLTVCGLPVFEGPIREDVIMTLDELPDSPPRPVPG